MLADGWTLTERTRVDVWQGCCWYTSLGLYPEPDPGWHEKAG